MGKKKRYDDYYYNSVGGGNDFYMEDDAISKKNAMMDKAYRVVQEDTFGDLPTYEAKRSTVIPKLYKKLGMEDRVEETLSPKSSRFVPDSLYLPDRGEGITERARTRTLYEESRINKMKNDLLKQALYKPMSSNKKELTLGEILAKYGDVVDTDKKIINKEEEVLEFAKQNYPNLKYVKRMSEDTLMLEDASGERFYVSNNSKVPLEINTDNPTSQGYKYIKAKNNMFRLAPNEYKESGTKMLSDKEIIDLQENKGFKGEWAEHWGNSKQKVSQNPTKNKILSGIGWDTLRTMDGTLGDYTNKHWTADGYGTLEKLNIKEDVKRSDAEAFIQEYGYLPKDATPEQVGEYYSKLGDTSLKGSLGRLNYQIANSLAPYNKSTADYVWEYNSNKNGNKIGNAVVDFVGNIGGMYMNPGYSYGGPGTNMMNITDDVAQIGGLKAGAKLGRTGTGKLNSAYNTITREGSRLAIDGGMGGALDTLRENQPLENLPTNVATGMAGSLVLGGGLKTVGAGKVAFDNYKANTPKAQLEKIINEPDMQKMNDFSMRNVDSTNKTQNMQINDKDIGDLYSQTVSRHKYYGDSKLGLEDNLDESTTVDSPKANDVADFDYYKKLQAEHDLNRKTVSDYANEKGISIEKAEQELGVDLRSLEAEIGKIDPNNPTTVEYRQVKAEYENAKNELLAYMKMKGLNPNSGKDVQRAISETGINTVEIEARLKQAEAKISDYGTRATDQITNSYVRIESDEDGNVINGTVIPKEGDFPQGKNDVIIKNDRVDNNIVRNNNHEINRETSEVGSVSYKSAKTKVNIPISNGNVEFKKGAIINTNNGTGEIYRVDADGTITVVDNFGTPYKFTEEELRGFNNEGEQLGFNLDSSQIKSDTKAMNDTAKQNVESDNMVASLRNEIDTIQSRIDTLNTQINDLNNRRGISGEHTKLKIMELQQRRTELERQLKEKQSELENRQINLTPNLIKTPGDSYANGEYNQFIPEIKTTKQIEKDNAPKTLWEDVSSKMKFFMNHAVDKTRAVKYFNEKAWELMTNVKAHQNTSKYIITNGLVGLDKTQIVNPRTGRAFGSFMSLFEGLDKKGMSDFVQYQTLKQNIARADITTKVQKIENGKPVFDTKGNPVMVEVVVKKGTPVVPDLNKADTLLLISEIEKANPEFLARARDFDDWWRAFQNEYFVKGGLSDEESIAMFQDLYRNYVTTKRAGFDKSNAITLNEKTTGSSRTIINPPESMMKMIEATSQRVALNKGKKAIYDVLLENQKNGVKSEYGQALGKNYKYTEGETGIDWIYINGEKYYFRIDDKNLKEAIENANKSVASELINKKAKIMGKETISYGDVVRLHKSLATKYNPIFANFTNPINDYFTYMIHNDMGFIEANKRYNQARKQLKSNSIEAQRFKASGVQAAGGRYGNLSTEDIADLMMKAKDTKTKNKLMKLMDKYGESAERKESIGRLAVFNKVLDETGDIDAAIFKSMDSTVNFGMYGSSSKKVGDALGSFLTTQIAGLDRAGRNFTTKGKAIKTEFKTGEGLGKFKTLSKEGKKIATLYTVPTVALWLINKDDPAYQDLPQRQKDLYYNIPTGDGEFLKLPKGRLYGLLFSAGLERGLEATLNGKGLDAAKGYGSMLTSEMPDPTASMYNPITIDLLRNKNWADKTIVPQYLKDNYEPKDQYTESTSQVAIKLGQLTNISPMIYDHIFDSYGYTIGSWLSTGVDVATGGTLPQEGFNKAIKSKFIVDSKFSNQTSQNYYDNPEKLSKMQGSIKRREGKSADELTGKAKSDYKNLSATKSSFIEANKEIARLTEKKKNAKTTKEKESYQAQIIELMRKTNNQSEKRLK